jgi:hypothetical protein
MANTKRKVKYTIYKKKHKLPLKPSNVDGKHQVSNSTR